jgi:predicted amidohydrolase YtcJ
LTRSGTEADLLIVGGPIHTMSGNATDDEAPVTAVAVRGGVVHAVGGEEVLDLRGERTEVLDLAGSALLPGFVDAHIHALAGGLARLTCDLSGVHSLTDYRRLIADYAGRHDGPWIEGSGWYGDVFPGGFPGRAELDRLVPDRPAAFVSHDVHSFWVNSVALRVAGIDRSTSDPPGGRITHDEHGEPTGHLLESAGELLAPHRPAVSQEQMRAALAQAQTYLHSVGVTAWQDAMIGQLFGLPDNYDTYRMAAEDGSLLSRVTGALWWEPGDDVDRVGELVDRRDRAAGRFTATAAKLMLDGVCENLTASVHDPYAGHPHERGLSMYDQEQLRVVTGALSAAGFDLHLHAVGDRAVTDALDAIAGSKDARRRHQVAHLDLVTREDLERMAQLGAIANVSPLWARLDTVLVETKLPLLTADQQERHFPFGSLRSRGVPIAFGSDWPVSSPDPIGALHTAVNRTAAQGDVHADDQRSRTEPLLPGERLSLDAALTAYTGEAARASRLDAHLGAIAPGMDADFVQLDTDPYAVEADSLGNLRVTATYVAGRRVFER